MTPNHKSTPSPHLGPQPNFSFLLEQAKRAPIVWVARQLFTKVKRANRCYMIKCPFHLDNTPSLALYEDTNSFYCFGCGKGGDVIRFVESLYDCGFKEAITRLAHNSYGL
ncbi:hypothetical protein KBD61_04525 [Patescibacteria group bacterium]|nr:hypothetical protein [Patescibacteria group bacterium]MBP9710260.1 hypothetical protein [Patescibacteria group bacterium]